mmetsp:Transcript_20993/g.44688  ORF Transcript_20993/g.44688 Transcript_20993/m.44688 type:complete len:226 (+) Transcript_20993:1008-1685(+)
MPCASAPPPRRRRFSLGGWPRGPEVPVALREAWPFPGRGALLVVVLTPWRRPHWGTAALQKLRCGDEGEEAVSPPPVHPRWPRRRLHRLAAAAHRWRRGSCPHPAPQPAWPGWQRHPLQRPRCLPPPKLRHGQGPDRRGRLDPRRSAPPPLRGRQPSTRMRYAAAEMSLPPVGPAEDAPLPSAWPPERQSPSTSPPQPAQPARPALPARPPPQGATGPWDRRPPP